MGVGSGVIGGGFLGSSILGGGTITENGNGGGPITIETFNISASIEGSGEIVVTKPTGVEPGDLLVIICTFRAADVTSTPIPTGWSKQIDFPGEEILYKVSDGTEPASYTLNLGSSIDDCVAIYMRLSNAKNTQTFTTQFTGGSTDAITATGVAVSDNSLAVYAINVQGGGAEITGGDNDGFTILGEAASGGTGENRTQFGYKYFETAATSETVTANCTLGDVYGWRARQFEIEGV